MKGGALLMMAFVLLNMGAPDKGTGDGGKEDDGSRRPPGPVVEPPWPIRSTTFRKIGQRLAWCYCCQIRPCHQTERSSDRICAESGTARACNCATHPACGKWHAATVPHTASHGASRSGAAMRMPLLGLGIRRWHSQ